jgi:hypothetical protein
MKIISLNNRSERIKNHSTFLLQLCPDEKKHSACLPLEVNRPTNPMLRSSRKVPLSVSLKYTYERINNIGVEVFRVSLLFRLD